MGFPPRSWFGHRTMGMHAFPVLYQGHGHGRSHLLRGVLDRAGLSRTRAAAFVGSVTASSTTCDIADALSEDEAATLGLSAGSHPGQARGGVDTAWRGSEEPSLRSGGGPAVDTPGSSSVQGADLVRDSPGRRRGRGSSCSPWSTTSRSSGPAVPASIASCNRATGRRRQQRVSGGADLPSASGPRDRRVPGLGPIPQNRRLARLPATARCSRPAVRCRRSRDGPDRPLRGKDDRRRVAARSRGTAVAGRLVPLEGAASTSEMPIDEHFRLWFTDNALHGDDESAGEPDPHRELPGRAAPGTS